MANVDAEGQRLATNDLSGFPMTIKTAILEEALAGRSILLRLGAIAVGSLLLAVSAWVEVPMVPVPLTLQTLAIVLIAALAGPRLTAAIIGAYLLEGLVGLPVFAGGAGGPQHLIGPTGGYLMGFLLGGIVAAAIAGRTLSLWRVAVAGLAAHAIILGAGWAWLSLLIGPEAAFAGGVAPFLLGSLVKIGLAALLLKASAPAIEKFVR